MGRKDIVSPNMYGTSFSLLILSGLYIVPFLIWKTLQNILLASYFPLFARHFSVLPQFFPPLGKCFFSGRTLLFVKKVFQGAGV